MEQESTRLDFSSFAVWVTLGQVPSPLRPQVAHLQSETNDAFSGAESQST